MIPGAHQTPAKRTPHALLVTETIFAVVRTRHLRNAWRNSAITPPILAPQALVFKMLPVQVLLETSISLASAQMGTMGPLVKQPSVCVTATPANTEARASMAWPGPPASVAQDSQVHAVKWMLMSAARNPATMERCAGMGLMNTPATVSQATKASTVTWR